MKIVSLPLVDANTRIEPAIMAMNRLRRRKIVVSLPSAAYVVHSNRAVLGAWTQRLKQVGRIEDGEPVIALLAHGDFRMERASAKERRSIERELDEADAMYGLLRINPGSSLGIPSVIVVTRHEILTDEATSRTMECVCSKNDRHNAKCPPGPPSGSSCPFGDRGIWLCA